MQKILLRDRVSPLLISIQINLIFYVSNHIYGRVEMAQQIGFKNPWQGDTPHLTDSFIELPRDLPEIEDPDFGNGNFSQSPNMIDLELVSKIESVAAPIIEEYVPSTLEDLNFEIDLLEPPKTTIVSEGVNPTKKRKKHQPKKNTQETMLLMQKIKEALLSKDYWYSNGEVRITYLAQKMGSNTYYVGNLIRYKLNGEILKIFGDVKKRSAQVTDEKRKDEVMRLVNTQEYRYFTGKVAYKKLKVATGLGVRTLQRIVHERKNEVVDIFGSVPRQTQKSLKVNKISEESILGILNSPQYRYTNGKVCFRKISEETGLPRACLVKVIERVEGELPRVSGTIPCRGSYARKGDEKAKE